MQLVVDLGAFDGDGQSAIRDLDADVLALFFALTQTPDFQQCTLSTYDVNHQMERARSCGVEHPSVG
jgi:hypothetical protein